MNRRYIAAVAALAVSALAATSANAQTAVVSMGTADTVVDIASIQVTGLPVDGIDIGSVRSFASTDTNALYNPVGKGQPFAIAKVTLPDGSSQSVRSDGESGKEGTTLPIGTIGSVTVGNLKASAGGDAASSVVNAVDGELHTVLAGLKARAAGVNSVVAADRASTTNGAVVEHISVGLDDVLPADLLEKLPLSKVLGIVDGLNLPVDLGVLDGAADEIRKLSGAIDDVQETYGDVVEAEDKVDAAESAVADAGDSLGAAEAAKDQAERGLSNLMSRFSTQSVVDDVVGGVEDAVGGGQDTVDDIADDVSDTVDDVAGGGDGDSDNDGTPDVVERQRQRLNDAIKRVEAAQDALEVANDALAQAQAQLDALIDQLQDLLALVGDLADKAVKLDLQGLLSALLEQIDGVELIGIDRMSLGVTTVADAVSSKASTVCELSGVRILGQDKAIADCAALETAVSDVEAKLDEVIALLPVQGVVPANVVTVSGPRLSSTPANHAAEGYRIAVAKVSGLDLDVQSISLGQVADSMVKVIRGTVDDALAKVEGLTGVTLPVADVEAALDGLVAELDTLPTGDLLRGITTPEVHVSAIDIASRSTFKAAGSGTDSVGVGAAGDLPHTGSGLGLTALLLLAGGAVVSAVTRPRGSRMGA